MSDSLSLSEYLSVDRILIDANVASAKKLLQTTARLLAQDLIVEDDELDIEKEIYQGLIEREKLGNTGMGNGIALPHCRCEFVEQPRITVITVEDGVDYGSSDKKPVVLALGLLVPKECTDQHLKILAAIAKRLSQSEIKEAVLSADSPRQLIQILS